MDELIKELRNKRKKYEDKAKAVEHKSDPSERERNYGISDGLQKAIAMLQEYEEEAREIGDEFNLMMAESYDLGDEELNWGKFITIRVGEVFDFQWLNSDKMAETFIFRIEEVE